LRKAGTREKASPPGRETRRIMEKEVSGGTAADARLGDIGD